MSALPVAILAGGLATRLRPVTETVPKSLLRIAGRPFIDWQLELLAGQGVELVVLCVGYLSDPIQAAVGDGARFGLTVRYSFDGEIPLGTGGALRQALSLLGGAFFVLYGDSYLPCSLSAARTAYEASGAPGLMTVFRNEDRWDRSNVLFRDGRIVEYDKRSPPPDASHIDYGLGLLSRGPLAKWPAGVPFDLADLYHDLSVRGELAGLEVNERFHEIGSVAGIEETERYLTQRLAQTFAHTSAPASAHEEGRT